jgi:glycerol-3-phosphate dehydrogenase subunit C
VHFLRFEFDHEMARALKYGVGLALGLDHPNYQAEVSAVAAGVRASLTQDLD